jgi:hypothetical protein
MDWFAWNIRGAYCHVSVMSQLVKLEVAMKHYKRISACYIGGPTTNETIA